MARLPTASAAETVRALRAAGFEVVRQKGSHAILKRSGREFLVTVPVHRGDLASGTLRAIIRDSGLTVEEFSALL